MLTFASCGYRALAFHIGFGLFPGFLFDLVFIFFYYALTENQFPNLEALFER